ncbi:MULTISPECIES: DUF6069 family protein [Amycolatopsis]|uniref:Uncharacterized protein n=1 Tax=Amycolatopsis bullii TaxID=941987 RepID=A0ABQ3KZ46_9PSEU|nr:DUF6069 family protein [Amycolatopsis bullii]GHG45580.1 hypothetical protein GCM10017567_80140 [Amycolatopsis bullii]
MTTIPRRTTTTALRLGFAFLAAAAANTGIALGALALDDGGIAMGLSPAVYLPATAVGLLLGTVGWFVLARRAPHALRVVVPAVLVLTWVPDLLLFTAGATAANVFGLMLMHLVVTTAVVTALRPTLANR